MKRPEFGLKRTSNSQGTTGKKNEINHTFENALFSMSSEVKTGPRAQSELCLSEVNER